MACFESLPNETLGRIIHFLFETYDCMTRIPLGPNGRSGPILNIRAVCKRFDSCIIRYLSLRLLVIRPIIPHRAPHLKQTPWLLTRLLFEAVNSRGSLRKNPLIAILDETSEFIVSNVSNTGHQAVDMRAAWKYAVCRTAICHLGLSVIHIAISSQWDVGLRGLDSRNAALVVAAYENDIDLVNRLLDQGANVNFEHPFLGNAIGMAAVRGNEAIVKLLLRMDASPNVMDNEGWTALHRAAYGGRASVIELLLRRADIDPNITTLRSRLTPLNLAVHRGNADAVRVLLTREIIDVNHPPLEDRAPLCMVMPHKGDEIARLLLDRADIDVNLVFPGSSKMSILSKAVECCATSVVRLLLQHKDIDVKVRTQGGQTLLHLAAKRNYTQIVELLLAHHDSDPNATCNNGRTPLGLAAVLGYEDVAKLLLAYPHVKAGANEKRGETPLILAAGRGKAGVVSLLLEHNDVDVNCTTTNGETPLLLAVKNGDAAIVKLLLDHGADKEINRDLIISARREHDLSVVSRF